MKGKFITIEGSEGSGKTTAIKVIADFLAQQNTKLITSREPGGTKVGEQIRDILLDENNLDLHADTELLLMFAARAQHWHTKILPNLQAGTWVVSDRFVDSSFAYQGGGRGVELSRIEQLSSWVLGENQPDLTLFLDLPPQIGLERIKIRSELDRFELEQLDFFNRVRQVFLDRAQILPRFVIIDASQTEIKVQQQITYTLGKIFQ